jgi:hypothetical protein
MDPNANLAEQERIIIRVEVDAPMRRPFKRQQAERLLDLRQALYDWIRDGGFEPDWSKAPNAAKYYGK